MKKILVPFDFSKPAIDAYRFALDIASDLKSVVQLIHVIELPVLGDAGAMSVLAFEEQLLNELKEKATHQFQKITEKYKSEHVKVMWNVVFGAPSKQITDVIKDQHIDLVVMGSHGASGLREYLLGSNAEKIIRKSPVPVFIIKSYSKGAIQNIVFPNILDLYDQEDLIIKVKTLQKFFKAHLHIVWINTPLNFTSDVITKQRLNEFAHYYKLTDYTVNIFNHRNEQEGIIEFAKSVKGDLIAIGTHGRKGISHLINGSLAEDVANHSNTMVWTYTLKNEHVMVSNI
jgi:nucleotide-binding universal stress UspA family protein